MADLELRSGEADLRRLPSQARIAPATGSPASMSPSYIPPARVEEAHVERASIERGRPDVPLPIQPGSVYLAPGGPADPRAEEGSRRPVRRISRTPRPPDEDTGAIGDERRGGRSVSYPRLPPSRRIRAIPDRSGPAMGSGEPNPAAGSRAEKSKPAGPRKRGSSQAGEARAPVLSRSVRVETGAFNFPRLREIPRFDFPNPEDPYTLDIRAPFIGYYSVYEDPYLEARGCEFFEGFYLRFGPSRASYFGVCSRLGRHGFHHHHVHFYPCEIHGGHFFHIRDCLLCYPGGLYCQPVLDLEGDGGDGAPSDAELSDLEGPDSARALDGLVPTAILEIREAPDPGTLQLEAGPMGNAGNAGEEEPTPSIVPRKDSGGLRLSLEDLGPGQLSLALGIREFRSGLYDEAAESFFNSLIEDPRLPLVMVFLAESLFAIGEYEYSAEFFRQAFGGGGALALPPGGLEPIDRLFPELYGRREDFRKHLEILQERTALEPDGEDGLLVLAVNRFASGELPAAAIAFEGLLHAERTSDRILAGRFLLEIARKDAGLGMGIPELLSLTFGAPREELHEALAELSRAE